MSIDITQFLQTFYEESFEGLDIMENSLLSLDVGAADGEEINNIFRAAHSIKGGSGTFGLSAVADFTHVLETLLDEMRDGRREVSQPAVDLMLTSVDVLREMLSALSDDEALDTDRITDVHAQLEQMLSSATESSSNSSANSTVDLDSRERATESEVVNTAGWLIKFQPHLDLFRSGNDPVRIFRELEDLGKIDISVDLGKLPAFEDMDPEESYLSWQIILHSDSSREQIVEVFAWVEDDCDLEIAVIEAETVPLQKAAPDATLLDLPASDQSSVGQNQDKKQLNKVSDNKKPKEKVAKKSVSNEASSIRVGIDKVDDLINMVGELVITQSMLNQLGEDFEMDRLQKLQAGLAELERNTRELQESVMRVRMLPISFAFNRFPRLVHDLSQKLGKKIDLKLSGEQTELDKTVMEKISDPLVHLVRNSLDHGIELPAERLERGKEERGTLYLNAFHQGGSIVIEITDDGAGLDAEKLLKKAREKGLVGVDETLSKDKIHELIFHPGFSTAETVSDVSGRGVGMDVVRRNINSLGGAIEIESEIGVGTTITIRLPLTLAILDGQLVKVGGSTYIIPLVSIIESLQIQSGTVNTIAGDTELYKFREEYVPIVRLHQLFNVKAERELLTEGILMVVEGEGGKYSGLFIDDLLGQQQVVIKSLESNFRRVEGLSGATILGDGHVALILDVPGLVKLSRNRAKGHLGAVSDSSVAA